MTPLPSSLIDKPCRLAVYLPLYQQDLMGGVNRLRGVGDTQQLQGH